MNGLQKMYDEAMADDEPDLNYIKDIAHRIALTYGIAIKKDATRISIVQMHQQGIQYAMEGESPMYGPPANISFLEIVKVRLYVHAMLGWTSLLSPVRFAE